MHAPHGQAAGRREPQSRWIEADREMAGPALLGYGLCRWHAALSGPRGPGAAWSVGHALLLCSQLALTVVVLADAGTTTRRGGRHAAIGGVLMGVASVGGFAAATQTLLDLAVGFMSADRAAMARHYSSLAPHPLIRIVSGHASQALLPLSTMAWALVARPSGGSRSRAVAVLGSLGFIASLTRPDLLPVSGLLLWAILGVRLPAPPDWSGRATSLWRMAWLLALLVFFAAQVYAASGWHSPAFSWSWNNISDLGHLGCGPWAEDGHGPSWVCSPRHLVMNSGFITTGILLMVGAASCPYWPPTVAGRVARGGILALGVGYMISGWVPADLDKHIHQGCGALLVGVGGTVGLLASTVSLVRRHTESGALAGFLGTVTAGSFVMFIDGHFLGLGPGGAERLWAYTPLVWILVTAATSSRKTHATAP